MTHTGSNIGDGSYGWLGSIQLFGSGVECGLLQSLLPLTAVLSAFVAHD